MIALMGLFTADYGPTELEALLESIAQGDQDALAALYDHARGAVYGLALSYLKNGHDADDVAQDTFVRIWEKAALYRPQGSPMAWILTIARNLALMRLRERGKTAELEQEEWESAVLSVVRDRGFFSKAAFRFRSPTFFPAGLSCESLFPEVW